MPSRRATSVTFVDDPQAPAVAIPWRHLRSTWLVACVGLFVLALFYLMFTKGVFQPVHKVAMGVAAAGLLYGCAARLRNATRLSVRDEQLRVEHGPLPWRRPLLLSLKHIRTLRCDRHGSRLVLRTRRGEDLILLEDLPASSQDLLEPLLRDRLQLPTSSSTS